MKKLCFGGGVYWLMA